MGVIALHRSIQQVIGAIKTMITIEKKSLSYWSNIGPYSPWGKIDSEYRMSNGIRFVGTPSHGGIFIPQRLQKTYIPSVFNKKPGWFEEDCEASVFFAFFPDEMLQVAIDAMYITPPPGKEAYMSPAGFRTRAFNSLETWFPDEMKTLKSCNAS